MKYLFPILLLACGSTADAVSLQEAPTAEVITATAVVAATPAWLNPEGTTVATRFIPNPGFAREKASAGDWASYLRNSKLKPDGAKVHLYTGAEKYSQELHAGVLDVSVGNEDLQQCADAVMRLRAEFLWKAERYDDISFNFVNGFSADYSRWRAGERIWIEGNKTGWKTGNGATTDRTSFEKYLRWVFMYANGTIAYSTPCCYIYSETTTHTLC